MWTAVRGAVQGTVSTQYIFRHLLWTHYFPGHFSFKFSLPRGDHALREEAKTHQGVPEQGDSMQEGMMKEAEQVV